ncbi:MAG: DUF1289 domain-containing protein [Burkholderiaceae bacterium]
MASNDEPLSPCIAVCRLDPDTRICTGCLRTIDEIAAWGQLDSRAKHAVLARVRERRARGTGNRRDDGESS